LLIGFDLIVYPQRPFLMTSSMSACNVSAGMPSFKQADTSSLKDSLALLSGVVGVFLDGTDVFLRVLMVIS
jgi:hypothetical protein